MLFNKEKRKVKTNLDCLSCKYYDKAKKKCNGLGKNCFEYDTITKVAIDPVTHFAIKIKE